ncbi:MAG: hypothetical protein ACFE95_18955, partial [Candidatus Hodarchaeota archaeon]
MRQVNSRSNLQIILIVFTICFLQVPISEPFFCNKEFFTDSALSGNELKAFVTKCVPKIQYTDVKVWENLHKVINETLIFNESTFLMINNSIIE